MLVDGFACEKAAVDESDIRIAVATRVLSFIGSRQYSSRLALKLGQRLQQQVADAWNGRWRGAAETGENVPRRPHARVSTNDQ
jgi:hypothetical protein